MAKTGTFEPVEITPGIQPPADKTSFSTSHYTYADKIRFENGFPRKIGGWIQLVFNYGLTIAGTVRSIFSDLINGKYYIVLGSNEKLYSLIGSTLTNITPFDPDDIAIANSLDTHYDTLANNPFTSVDGSSFVTVADADAGLLEAGDIVYISGATTFAGIPALNLNGDALVREVGIGVFTINVGVNATSSTSGGGNAVIRSSGLLTVNATAHGQLDGDRVKIEDAANTGGILAAEINKEFIIRNVTTDTFDIMTDGEATSSVTAGGGASTIYYEEIPPGNLNETNMTGYGAGLYGAGLYGTALQSTTGRSLPRIWFIDRYANTMVMTPGNQGGVYQWFASAEVAPEQVTNAPTEVNYVFVSDNILVTLGAGGIENRVFASDQNDIEMWVSSSTNQVFDDDIEGAGRLLSHVPVQDYNLLFTENKTYTFRYIGLPFVWEIKPLDETVGIIAPMARVSVKGVAFWMGTQNFYMYRGGVVEVIPANTQHESTCLNYVFSDMNWGQKSKFFAWYNVENDEVWFHYATGNSNECDRVVVVNVQEFTWTLHTFDRTAAEYPAPRLKNPRLINVGTLYQHEFGVNDNGSGMSWELLGPKRYWGKDNVNVNRIVPDNILTGNMTFADTAYLFPQSQTAIGTSSVTINGTTEQQPILRSGRIHQYNFSGSDVDQEFIMGQWLEEIQKGPTE